MNTTLTANAEVEFINDLEGTGDLSVDFITNQIDDDDAAVVTWCKIQLGRELDTEEAWGEVYKWCEKEDVPLKGKYLELCQKEVQDSIDHKNGGGLFEDHNAAVVIFALVESFDEHLCSLLSENAEYVYSDVMDGLPAISGFQYLEAAKPVIEREVKSLLEKEGHKGLFERALYADESRLGDTRKLLKAYVEKYPEHKVALVEALIDEVARTLLDLETWLCAEEWYEGLEDAFTIKAKEIYKTACVSWNMEGDKVLNELPTAVRQALAKGGVGSDEILSDKELNEELAWLKEVSPAPQVGAELLKRNAAMEKAGVATSDILIRCGYFKEGDDYGWANIKFSDAKIAAQKLDDGKSESFELPTDTEEPQTIMLSIEKAVVAETNVDKVEIDLQETFDTALDDCNFDAIFADADNYQELIEKTIDEIASNFTEESEFCASGNEPEWLMKLLLKAGACVGSEAPEPTPVMQSLEVNTKDDDYIEPVAEMNLTKHELQLDIATTDKSDNGDGCYFKILTPYGFTGLYRPYCTEVQGWDEVEEYKVGNPGEDATLIRVEIDTNSLWTMWHYDNEYQTIEEADEITFNTRDDLELYRQTMNGHGHTSFVRILVNTNGQCESFLPEDLDMHGLGAGETYADLRDEACLDPVFSAQFCNQDAEYTEDEIGLEAFKDLIRTGQYPIDEVATSSADAVAFTGKRVCVTGKLSKTRKEVEALLEAAGAIIAGSISKTTDYLVAGADAGSKISKAADLGVTVLTEEQMTEALHVA